MTFQWLLGGGLLLIAVLYLGLSLRDTRDEFLAIFDSRILRRGLRFHSRDSHYSIIDLMVLTGLLGAVMAMAQAGAINRGAAWLWGIAFIGGYYAAKYIKYDLTMTGQRREYPRMLKLSRPTVSARPPAIDVPMVDAPVVDAPLIDVYDPGE